MLIDDIDFADLYLQQLKLAHRTEKTPDHWDQRAEKMAENCASPTDSYLQQLTSKIDLQGAQTLFDMGCGPGTVSLALTGGINLTTLKNYLDCGIRLFITSAPYYATPADIKVSLQPAASI